MLELDSDGKVNVDSLKDNLTDDTIILKYIKMATSGNFGNMLWMFGLLVIYVMVIQMYKKMYLRKNKEWL